ncbi:LysE family translocator [Pseudomonas sp. CAU 1711]|uniref:LysE family translocator n=1 Tax=Pseudomonas sp. CAU 1711 TaxID=3140356 RepID=UPI0032602DB4
MAFDLWLIYLVATLGLALTPGPNSLLALTHGGLYGARRALATILGGVVGFGLLIALAMFGLSALLKAVPAALLALKWLGGAYLIWLGVQLWRTPALLPGMALGAPQPALLGLFRQGLLSALSNPKVILFYGAFLPQFLDPQRGLLVQFAVMAATFAVVGFLVELALALLAFRVRPWLQRGGRAFNRCCGLLFVLLGLALPLAR